MTNDFKVLKNVPKNIGHGEGGGNLPKLYDILKQIDSKLYELEQKTEQEKDQ